MINDQQIKAVQDFLDWIENNTYYEIGEDVQSDYGDGESNFYSVDMKTLLKEYKESFE